MQSTWNWKSQRTQSAFLALEDGTIFRGHSVGAALDSVGEVVFNTGMTGYQEILSDPSYAGQFVTMTYPEIGNTGVNNDDMEADRFFAGGLIIHELNEPSNWRATAALQTRLCSENIPALAGIETRALTILLRTKGTTKACLAASGNLTERQAVEKARNWIGLDNQDYAARVTCKAKYDFDEQSHLTHSWGSADKIPEPDMRIAVYDFGVKRNILRCLRRAGMAATVVPAQTSAADVLAMDPDGIFFSNGPADPAALTYAIEAARALLGRKPLMGICLGHQILGLAVGGTTYRLKFGHHGCNHPVKNLLTGGIEITSQNHNYAVSSDSLAQAPVNITHINLNDQTVEGIAHKTEPMFAVQYHPEAAPGPHDPLYLFAAFRKLIGKA